jgi:CRP-like cAMP-binding protein
MNRPITHSLVKALRRVPGFDLLQDIWLLKVVGASQNLLWPGGSKVFEKGTPGDALYIVLSGEIRVFDIVDGSELNVANIKPGDYFGEMSLMSDSVHTKSVEAVEDTELLVLPKDSFEALLESSPDLEALVKRRLAERRGELARLSVDVDAPAG